MMTIIKGCVLFLSAVFYLFMTFYAPIHSCDDLSQATNVLQEVMYQVTSFEVPNE